MVRRTGATGEPEVLVLHRSTPGEGFEGDWAWTSPAGCRQPGEAVYPAALRELAEEAGIAGPAPWAVDLGGDWACFAVDVPSETVVDLVDPEHDGYAWVGPEEAVRRIRPVFVARQQARAAAVPRIEPAFRPMTPADLAALARWQSAPHVAPWWDPRGRSEDAVRARYTPRLRGDEPIRMWVVEADGRAVGFIEDYRVRDQPDYAAKTRDPDAVGFDYAIGEADLVSRGFGTRMVWEFCRGVLHRDYPDAEHFLASPSRRNLASLRVLGKCGFTEGLWIAAPRPDEAADTEIVCTLDVRHWLG
ncbi:MAG: aminoglycoside 6-N-acetyltransferase [Nocardioidaceae bacterium]|nr:aminoglycoside 6-N-acetyltransferase [Nocardioidaceae bacterium]MDX6309598.1 aminoglycoside 6-N-acetyltransferase [Nocardioidaceae bacterium]